MNKMVLLNKIRQLYEESDTNIIQWLRNESGEERNDIADILISYDFQAGTYIQDYYKMKDFRNQYLSRLVSIIDGLGDENKSILECGCGETTILVPLLKLLNRKFDDVAGIDISWSRIKYGQKFAEENLDGGVSLVVGDMFNLPCADNSFDIVFTRQAIEPNRGHEKEILAELYRAANNYVIMIEPAYELANEEARKRMDEHGYIQNLYGSAQELGLNVTTWELYGINEVELNPVGLMIIEKGKGTTGKAGWSCPITKTELKTVGGCMYSEESLLAYPIINGVPMLTKENAIVATKMMEFK